MTKDQVAAELRTFIRSAFKVSEGDKDFTDDVHLFDYGYIDSFGATELISFVEKRFQVKISDQDLVIHPLNTVNEISALVHQRLGAA